MLFEQFRIYEFIILIIFTVFKYLILKSIVC